MLAAHVRQGAPKQRFSPVCSVPLQHWEDERIAPCINADTGSFRWSWHFATLSAELLTGFFSDFRRLQTEN